jgi:hypothetical protein
MIKCRPPRGLTGTRHFLYSLKDFYLAYAYGSRQIILASAAKTRKNHAACGVQEINLDFYVFFCYNYFVKLF